MTARLVSLATALLLLAFAADAAASVKVTRSVRDGEAFYTITAEKVPVSEVAKKVAEAIGTSATVASGADRPVTFVLRDLRKEKVWYSVASASGLTLSEKKGKLTLLAGEPTADLDVKNAELQEILASLKKQCGVRNIVVDPGVTGSGTFLFHDVPCSEAFQVVFRSLGLEGQFKGSSVVTVHE